MPLQPDPLPSSLQAHATFRRQLSSHSELVPRGRRYGRVRSLLVLLGLACGAPQIASQASPRASIEARYAQLAQAIRGNRVDEILAIQASTFTSLNVTGQVFDYQAMADYTRRLSGAIDSVIHIQNRIRQFDVVAPDTVVAHVCQEFSRIQRIGDGAAHRVDTSALQTETWIRQAAGWFRNRVEDVHGTRWFVDQVRVDPTQRYTPGALPYQPAVDSATGCGLR